MAPVEKVRVYCVWLLAVAACAAPVAPSAERDRSNPVQPTPDAGRDLVLSDPAPVPNEDAGSEPDRPPPPAADGGSGKAPDSSVPMMEPMPAPPPLPAPLSLRFDPPGGGFSEPLLLSLEAADPEAVVHYTLDGTIPSTDSPVARAPLRIEATTLVRAVAARDRRLGEITNQVYFQLAPDVLSFRSNLPVVVIDMLHGAAPDPLSYEHVGALIGVFEPIAGTAELERSATVTSRIGIKVRGRSTRNQDKSSYTVELRGVNDEDAPAALMGMPAEGDWVLYAPYRYDRSLMHNALGYELSRRIGRYAPRTAFCEVFLVTGPERVSAANYHGVYVLTERITRGDDRVAVSKLRGSDISGGYIMQMNTPDPGDVPFSGAGRQFLHVYPKQDDVLLEEVQYISGYLDAVQRAAAAADGVDATTGQHYASLIDVPAFIDHHILSVLVKNPDAFALSSYFHKDRGGPLVAGPLWDLDLAMGADDPWGQRSREPTGWNPSTDNIFGRSFWGPLFRQAAFEAQYWERWNELLDGPFQLAALNALIDTFEEQLIQAELRNRARWPESAPRNDSYAAEVQALRDWLATRVDWISANVGTR